MNINDMPIYKRPQRYRAVKQPWCEIEPPEKWVYLYDPPAVRKTKILNFLIERKKPIAERDLENAFCYSISDVNWTVKELVKEGKISRELIYFGKRRVAFVSIL